MHYRTLGNTDISISTLCLGTMTWGDRNTEAEAHEQLDYARAQGINFIDTAELYAVPPSAETQGKTEEYIGTWLQHQDRSKIILASKVLNDADGRNFDYVRPHPTYDAKNIREACEASLKRLRTDYIDLYQLHWPERATNFFGKLNYEHNPEQAFTPIEEVLSALNELVKEGKIRHIGLSNETPWGVMRFLQVAKEKNLPRVQSVQNPYSLLLRKDEIGLSEVCLREEVSYLAYSPLAGGALTGKYHGGAMPEDSRFATDPRPSRFRTPLGIEAAEAYVELAREVGLSPAHMALAFVNSRTFMGSNILGATNMAQLKENIESADITLSDDVLGRIHDLAVRYSNPCA